MRPKFVFALLLLALFALGAAFFLKQHFGSAATPPPVIESVTPAPVESAAPPPAPAPVAAAPATNSLTPEQRQTATDAEISRLQDWSESYDTASLSNILADLNNPDKEIRDAAIEAAKQFGSTNAIPALKAAVDNTDDTQEKIDLLEAADFLSLPPLTIGQAPQMTPEQMKAAAQQARQAHQNKLQKGARGQNPAGTQSSPDQNAPAGPNQ
jgi:hypothetical protein